MFNNLYIGQYEVLQFKKWLFETGKIPGMQQSTTINSSIIISIINITIYLNHNNIDTVFLSDFIWRSINTDRFYAKIDDQILL